MGLPALDEIRNALLEYLDFSFLSWAGQQNANEFSEISPGVIYCIVLVKKKNVRVPIQLSGDTLAEFRSVVKDTKSNTKYISKSISIHSDYQSVHFW